MWSYHAPWFSGPIDDSCRFCPKRAAFLHATAQRDQTNGSHLLKLRKNIYYNCAQPNPTSPNFPSSFSPPPAPWSPLRFGGHRQPTSLPGPPANHVDGGDANAAATADLSTSGNDPLKGEDSVPRFFERSCVVYFSFGEGETNSKLGSCVLTGSLELWGVEG